MHAGKENEFARDANKSHERKKEMKMEGNMDAFFFLRWRFLFLRFK